MSKQESNNMSQMYIGVQIISLDYNSFNYLLGVFTIYYELIKYKVIFRKKSLKIVYK